MQAPTSERQGLCKNSIALLKFHRRGEHCSPAFALPADPKIYPRTVAGLPCRPLQAKGKAYAKILSLFQNFIVGASIARPPKPCGITRPPGGAEPHPYYKPQESAFKFYRYFAISPYWRALLARPCRTRKPKNISPHRWRACNAGPYKRKIQACGKQYCSFVIFPYGRTKTPALLFGWQTAGAAPGFFL